MRVLQATKSGLMYIDRHKKNFWYHLSGIWEKMCQYNQSGTSHLAHVKNHHKLHQILSPVCSSCNLERAVNYSIFECAMPITMGVREQRHFGHANIKLSHPDINSWPNDNSRSDCIHVASDTTISFVSGSYSYLYEQMNITHSLISRPMLIVQTEYWIT